jgi:predicted AlkP superfamily pyrophosphatase or phosphodiesterase
MPGDDAKVTDQAIALLGEKDPDVLFLHFDDVDIAGHAKGFHPTVPEYTAAIERVDACIGRVLGALRARPTYAQEDWLILVSTDHGGRGTSHSDGADVPEIRTMFIIVSGAAAAREAPAEPTFVVDVAATALAHLGIPLKSEWQFDGKPVGLEK